MPLNDTWGKTLIFCSVDFSQNDSFLILFCPIPVSATREKMLVFTAYFQLIFTPEESSCHLPRPLVTAPWEVTAKKKKQICLPFWTYLVTNFLTRFFLVYFVAMEDCSS